MIQDLIQPAGSRRDEQIFEKMESDDILDVNMLTQNKSSYSLNYGDRVDHSMDTSFGNDCGVGDSGFIGKDSEGRLNDFLPSIRRS